MDKSPSNQDVDDGSWDAEENEDILHTLGNLSSNSWDTSSEEGKQRETKVEAFTIEEGMTSGERVVKAVERAVSEKSESSESCTVYERASRDEKAEECLIVEDFESDDDESVWKIPVSKHSESSEDIRMVRVKWKSEGDLVKIASRPKVSKSCDDLTGEVIFSLKDALMNFEGSCTSKEKKLALEDIVSLGVTGEHFQEIECRTLVTNVKKEASESDDGKDEQEHCCRGNPGGSKASEEASSLPDIAGASRSDRLGTHEFRKAMSYTNNRHLIHEKVESALTESWILLDEMGQSQPVTINEVNFLLNGRSADAVLQENKEHFIPKSTVVRNANSDLRVDEWNPLVEESLQHFLNEDPGGEESTTKSIRLERKFGNMLLYIQSGINLTSSVRFIPVDTEMIHMWRQSKETMSPISSEDDARISVSENVTEETSEWDNQEMSDDVRCAVHKPGPSVRKRRTRQGKIDECEYRTMENRRIIDSLTDEIKQLRMRLDAERCRSSGLEQENYRLRGQLDKCKSGRSSTDSRKTKSDISDDCRKQPVPDVSSSSLLSIEEYKEENMEREEEEEEERPKSHRQGSFIPDDDQKSFKETLDRKLNDIEEILKCKTRNQVKPEGSARAEDVPRGQIVDDNSRVSSSASVNTCAVAETTSQVMSETTGSTDSWFRPNKTEAGQRNISEIINDLEKENERLVIENMNLKKKLNEISLELDDYISSCAAQSPVEDGRQSESLRNQVCNLKLELENLKSLAKNKEQSYKLKDAIVREELAEKSISLDEWRTSIAAIFREMNDRLIEIGVSSPKTSPDDWKLNPKNLLTQMRSLMTSLTVKITDFQKENTVLKRSLQENIVSSSKMFGLERSFDVNFLQVPGLLFSNMSKDKSDEYYTLLSEKTSLEEEMKNLRKENDLLLEYQIENNERLKKVMTSLREEKAKADALEQGSKLMEIEKSEISEALMSCQKEKAIVESELHLEATKVAELRTECERRKSELKKLEIKLQEATNKIRSFDEASAVKDDIISELRSSCSQLETRETLHKDQIQFFTEQLKKLEDEKSNLVEELRSTKQIAEESSRGMSEYISHLETMVTNTEENLSEMKEKCNETVRSLTALRKAHDDLEKQNASNAKMYSKTKDELENCRDIIKELEEDYRKSEEGKRKALCDLSTIVKSEREKTETLEKLIAQRKLLDEEVSALRVKAETQAKTNDRLLKEQKDLINEMSMLKKEKGKLAQKYRNVKSECNERTKLLRRLDSKLKENFLEYNRRIACLERNVSNIIEKAAAYKETFLEKRTEVNAMVRELQEQLDTVYMEKKGLQSEAVNFYEAVKQLQRDINENKKEKRLNFLLEDQRERQESESVPPEDKTEPSASNSKDEGLESRLKSAEAELADAKERNRQLEDGKEDERNKYESIIAELKTQISRYQVRLEVMLRNISTYGRSMQEVATDKREAEGDEKIVTLEERIRDLTEELDKKRQRMLELTEVIETSESAMRKKEDECDSLREKVVHLKDEIKSMKNQFSKLQEFLTTVNRNVETYQKERDEVAGKLAKSLKLIVEERASKQSSEAIHAEKEKMFREQLEQLQVSLTEKKNEYEALLKGMDEKKGMISKLQEDVKKWKSEVGILKAQVITLKDQNAPRRESEAGDDATDGACRQKTISTELKEARAQNLELRKTEGTLQAKIVRLEDELRGARLLIKELEGDLRSEKTSKKLLKEMITTAREEIERFKRRGQILASIADKIDRHFNLSEVQSRELFSGYRTVE